MNQIRQILGLIFGPKEKNNPPPPSSPTPTPPPRPPAAVNPTTQGDSAVENPDAGRDLIDTVIQRLYENESLTSALTDDSATLLLKWGEEELTTLAQFSPDAQQVDDLSSQAARVLRFVNHTVERQADLTETELVETLIKLVQHAMQLGVIEFKIEQGITDGQKTEEQEKEVG